MPVSTLATQSDNLTGAAHYYLSNWGHSDMGRVQFNSHGIGFYRLKR